MFLSSLSISTRNPCLIICFITFSDWNPAVDKQAAARCWRDGQKKRCFTYRFLATGTVEEKIFQRQLSKEGLQSVVDDKEQVNALSTKDLRNLFKLRNGTPSDTHDKLRCDRCQIIQDNAELEAKKVLPKKLATCRELLDRMWEQEDAQYFHTPLNSQDYGVPKEEYERIVKQPMDLGTIKSRLCMSQDQPSAYQSISGVSKDVNRIFANVMKVWAPEDAISEAAGRLQSWWIGQWTELVPVLMAMKSDSDESQDSSNDDSGVHHDLLETCAALNRRGDDYQEQIGMPDEENMRSWSHHHTVDTVDDPVFRAAMRGYDSVSFVFGLEVTWSLIQQRQQEEEERQALKELEAAQELGQEESSENQKGDDSDDGAGQDDGEVQSESSKNEVMTKDDKDVELVNNEIKGGGNSSNDLEDSDDEGPSGGSIEGGETPPKSQEHKVEVVDESPDNGTPDAVIVDSSHEDSPAVTPMEVDQTDYSDIDSVKQENKHPTHCVRWECTACTFMNEKSDKKCSVCETRRPAASGTKRSIHEIG